MSEQTYRVTGTQEVNGTPPGEVFKADLDPVMEERLIAAGAITKEQASTQKRETKGKG